MILLHLIKIHLCTKMQVRSLSRVFAICQLSDSCCRKNISIMNDDIEMETVTENDKPFIFLNSLMLLSANSRHEGGHFFKMCFAFQ